MTHTLNKDDRGRAALVAALGLVVMIFCCGINTTSTAILLPTWTEEMGFTTAQYGLLAGGIAMGVVWTVWLTAFCLTNLTLRL